MTQSMKKTMIGLAWCFGAYGGALLIWAHDWKDGLWSLAVCFALILGIIPWEKLQIKRDVGPDKASQLRAPLKH